MEAKQQTKHERGDNMARPAKTASIIALEGKSHRTKKELAYRRRQENANLTGQPLKEDRNTRVNEVAHKEFLRLKKIMKAIEKDDAIYSAVINRYCIITSEVAALETTRMSLNELAEEIKNHRDDYDSFKEYSKALVEMQGQILSVDISIQKKRQQLFQIEKENCMTVSSSLRVFNKTPETKTNALKEALGG